MCALALAFCNTCQICTCFIGLSLFQLPPLPVPMSRTELGDMGGMAVWSGTIYASVPMSSGAWFRPPEGARKRSEARDEDIDALIAQSSQDRAHQRARTIAYLQSHKRCKSSESVDKGAVLVQDRPLLETRKARSHSPHADSPQPSAPSHAERRQSAAMYTSRAERRQSAGMYTSLARRPLASDSRALAPHTLSVAGSAQAGAIPSATTRPMGATTGTLGCPCSMATRSPKTSCRS